MPNASKTPAIAPSSASTEKQSFAPWNSFPRAERHATTRSMLTPFRAVEHELEHIMCSISRSKNKRTIALWEKAYQAREMLRECGDMFELSMLKDKRPHSSQRKR